MNGWLNNVVLGFCALDSPISTLATWAGWTLLASPGWESHGAGPTSCTCFFCFFFLCQKKRIDRLFIRNPQNSFLCHLWGFCATSSWAELESLEVSVLGCLWGMDTSHARKGPGHELKHLEAFSFHFSSLVWCIAFRCVSKLRSFIYIYILVFPSRSFLYNRLKL